MTTLTASSKYTARNGQEYGLLTADDIYALGAAGNNYNQIVDLLNSNNVDMDGLRTDIYGGVNSGLTTEEVIQRSVGDKYYDGTAGPTEGKTEYFMDPKGNTALQAIALVNDYDKAVADKNQLAIDGYNKVYGSREGILNYYKTGPGSGSSSTASNTSNSNTTPSTTKPTENTSTYTPPDFKYGVAPKSESSSSIKEQPYVQWDAQFGMGNAKDGAWLNNAMKDAVGVGFTDTSKGQQFEQVLNTTDKKPANAAAGPDIFQTLINTY